MKIAFRLLPFSDIQNEQLNRLALQGGYDPVWYSADEYPDPVLLNDCKALIGYFPVDVISQLPNLRWVQTPCAGVERYCKNIYLRDDAVLTNCSGAFGVAISEYMLTGLLMLMRSMPAYMDNQRKGVWQCMGSSRSVFGSRIAVVGMGNIGTSFAVRAKALGATVCGVCRTPRLNHEGYDEVYLSSHLKQAVNGADAVVLSLPATNATKGLFSRDIIDSLSEKTIVVNCGRGCTVDQTALTNALLEGRIAGAVLDVFETEPLPSDNPLWAMKNVILTPHISGRDSDPINTSAIFDICRENLCRFINGKALLHTVDRSLGY